MNRNNRWKTSVTALLAGLGLGFTAPSLLSQTVTYTVDPMLSRISLSSYFGGTFGWGQFTIISQSPGTLADCWEGSIVATKQADGSLVFSGGSTLRARLNPNSPSQDPLDPSFRPHQDDPNQPWNGVDNYAARCFLFDSIPIYTAYRDLVWDITSGSASPAAAPSQRMTLQVTEGHRDWSVVALNSGDVTPAKNWPVSSGANESPRNVSLSADGSVLTIPVVLKTKSFDNAIVTFEEVWSGTIVATTAAPTTTAPQPRLVLTPAGPAGLQFNATGSTATHYNGITTAPWIEGSWVGVTTPENPASYSFTIAAGPSPASKGFLTHMWLIPSPISYSTEVYSGSANPNVIRLNLENDGEGGVTATLGYRVNAPQDEEAFLGKGFICGITNAPATGTWTLQLTNDTHFTLIAPNGSEAQGSFADEQAAVFKEKVRFYLGVNPNGAANIGQSVTISSAAIRIPGGNRTSLIGNWETGAPLHKNWTLLAADPASVMMKPAFSVYRAEWNDVCNTGIGSHVLEKSPTLFDATAWTPVETPVISLATGYNVGFIREDDAPVGSGFFRVTVP